MDKKVLYALTSKIFNTLKKLGIKPKIGVTTGVKRLPGSRNSFNTDLSKLEGGDPEGLKRLIANDADFLPQATPDEIAQYNNNLEYLQSTFPEVFSKPQVVTEAKTGIKTLVDDVGEKIKKPTAQEVFDIFLLALQDEEIKIAGDIEGFKNALYEGFKDFTYRKRYTEEMLWEYIEMAMDSLVDDDPPMQQTDYLKGQQAAGL